MRAKHNEELSTEKYVCAAELRQSCRRTFMTRVCDLVDHVKGAHDAETTAKLSLLKSVLSSNESLMRLFRVIVITCAWGRVYRRTAKDGKYLKSLRF